MDQLSFNIVGEVAIVYMEDFQMRAQSENYPELRQWPWYIDDSVLEEKNEQMLY